jgi:hypothetical protein
MVARVVALVMALTFVAGTATADTTRYNPRRAGHPLRIIAYMLHPIGVVADTLFFHPAWWLGTHEPLRTLFGVEVVVDDSADIAREIELQKQQAQPAPEVPTPAPQEPDTEPSPAPSTPAP